MQNYTRRNKLTISQEKDKLFTKTHEKFVELVPHLLKKNWMKNPEATKDQELLEKLIRGGGTNLLEWFENITNEFCEEQAIEERISVETIQKKLYTDHIEQLLCSLPTLLFKFLIEK